MHASESTAVKKLSSVQSGVIRGRVFVHVVFFGGLSCLLWLLQVGGNLGLLRRVQNCWKCAQCRHFQHLQKKGDSCSVSYLRLFFDLEVKTRSVSYLYVFAYFVFVFGRRCTCGASKEEHEPLHGGHCCGNGWLSTRRCR